MKNNQKLTKIYITKNFIYENNQKFAPINVSFMKIIENLTD